MSLPTMHCQQRSAGEKARTDNLSSQISLLSSPFSVVHIPSDGVNRREDVRPTGIWQVQEQIKGNQRKTNTPRVTNAYQRLPPSARWVSVTNFAASWISNAAMFVQIFIRRTHLLRKQENPQTSGHQSAQRLKQSTKSLAEVSVPHKS